MYYLFYTIYKLLNRFINLYKLKLLFLITIINNAIINIIPLMNNNKNALLLLFQLHHLEIMA